MLGAGDAGVYQLLGQHRVERIRQHQGGVAELRALGLVHGHGEYRFHFVEPARQNEPHTTTAVVAREGHTQQRLALLIRQAQGYTDVTVHQAQAVVVAGHQHRAPFVPGLLAVDQPGIVQHPCHPFVEAFDTPGAPAHRAQQLEILETAQHLARPLLPGGVVKGGIKCWPVTPKGAQVAAVALRSIGTAVQTVQ
ncbi:hypothetical protein D9M73_179490 [compost metagenome]